MSSKHRVILGRAPANTTNKWYNRSDEFGLFVSQPGADVLNCNDASLIFDSTSSGQLQVLSSGYAIVPKANSLGMDYFGLAPRIGQIMNSGNVTVYTGIFADIHPSANSPMMVWVSHQDVDGTHTTNWPSINISNGWSGIYGAQVIQTIVYANTLSGNTVDIKFTNGQAEDHGVYWTLFKEPGATTDGVI
tara:strand:+ start:1532 stop:2101 length:570 start_codon:yes stop_codon:yes gene_type:complete